MEIKVMHQVMAWNEDVSDAVKAEMHVITPENYTGYSF